MYIIVIISWRCLVLQHVEPSAAQKVTVYSSRGNPPLTSSAVLLAWTPCLLNNDAVSCSSIWLPISYASFHTSRHKLRGKSPRHWRLIVRGNKINEQRILSSLFFKTLTLLALHKSCIGLVVICISSEKFERNQCSLKFIVVEIMTLKLSQRL